MISDINSYILLKLVFIYLNTLHRNVDIPFFLLKNDYKLLIMNIVGGIYMDDTLKQKISQFVDNEGKLIVQDDMPDDLKDAIKYLNDNNVNIFAPNDPMADMDDAEVFTEEITPEDLILEADPEVDNMDVDHMDLGEQEEITHEDHIEENVDAEQINDLQGMF